MSEQTSSRLVIRPFAPDDFSSVVELLQDVSAFRPEVNQSKGLADQFAGQALAYGAVAELDGQVIGFASIFVLERLRGGRSAVIEDVVVERKQRGLGVGRALVDDLLGFARSKQCFKATLEASPEAEAFYCALGFVTGGTSMKIGL